MSVSDPNTPSLVDPESPSQPIPPGNGNGNGNGHPQLPRITSIAPIGGLLTGGYDVALTGTGFQLGAEVFFGAVASPEVQVTSLGRVNAKVPPATQVGTVSVSLVNPDGESALAPGGFTYVSSEGSLHAEVLGVSPLSVIENTETEVTIRGRNLISAYDDGIVALRGPSRVQCAFSNFGSTTDSETGIDSLILTVRVTAAPPLEQHERIAIQVLASLRPDAANNGIFTSSRQMFTVLPRAVPVPLAFTANLDPGRPNLLIVAGRNLEGISLDLGGGATIHSQRSDDRTIAAVVSFPEGAPPSESVPLQLLDPAGESAGQFDVTFVQSLESVKSASSVDGTVMAAAEPRDGDVGLTLTPIPGQQLTGPTKEDSATFSLKGESLFPSWGFEAFFFYVEFDIDILIPLFNEVRLIPFFDNGVGDLIDNTPIVAEVGKLFRLRGVGLLVTLRVDLIIHIHVVIIIGIIFFPWDFGFFNEFGFDFPFGIGSIVVSIRVTVNIFLSLAFMVALVEPLGHLRVLFFFNLELGIDFFFSADNRILHFNTNLHFKVNYTRVSPFHSLLPCDGRFQLAEENGQTVFTDNFGNSVAFYFPRAAGPCCLTWDFQLSLVQFEQEGGPEEILQDSFRAEYCLNAAPPTNVVNIIVTSEHPAPTGIGLNRHLEMTLDDRAALIALAEPAEEDGTPTGPPEDVRNLGYDPEFLLEPLFPDLFNPVLFPSGDAIPVQAGENTIHVILHPRGETPQFFSFRPADIFGFVIQRFVSQGLLPAVIAGALPVIVQDPTKIIVKPILAFRDPNATDPNKLNEAPVLFTFPIAGNQIESVQRLNRCEPFETQPLKYFMAAKITSTPRGVNFPIKLKLKVPSDPEMKVFENGQLQTGAPLAGTDYLDDRPLVDAMSQFFSAVPPANQEREIEFNALNELKDLFPITPYLKEVAPTTTPTAAPRKLVPPGEKVANRTVVLVAKLDAEDASSAHTPVEQPPQLSIGIHHDETYEEYRRVFTQVQELFTGNDATVVKYREFAKEFLTDLMAGSSPPSASTLGQKGVELWKLAYEAVQASLLPNTQTPAPGVTLDDRLLYWTRLQAIGALKSYYSRKQGQSLNDTTLSQFEWPSRGLEQSGRIKLPSSGRRALVTGFDPFQLDSVIEKTNPSGMVALWLNAKTLTSTQGNTVISAAIFPVRYKEFDAGLVEKATKDDVTSITMLMTVSQGRGFYDVDRFAAKNRGGGLDNNHQNPASTVPLNLHPPVGPNPNGPEFIESSLPYERVITSVEATRKLPEPQTGPIFSSNAGFIVNQAYVSSGSSHPGTNDVRADETWKKLAKQPLPYVDAKHTGETSIDGSGGNFLSNEIFYRTARVRVKEKEALPSGHLHIPLLGSNGDEISLSPGLLVAVQTALVSFLNDKLQLRSLGDVAFPNTPITRPSAPLPLRAKNETASPVEVASVDVDLPQIFQLQTSLPATAPANGELALSFVFRPNTTNPPDFAAIARAKDASGKILFSAQLRGKALAAPPAPTVTGFTPSIGIIGDSVIINGTDFDGATEVRCGTVALTISAITSNQIEAEITPPPRTAQISVTTPSGTGTSAQSFAIRNPPRHPPEDLAAQLVARREELELSPQEAAARIGARPATYRRWERGLDRPSARFHAGVVAFIGHDPEPNPREFGEQIRAARERDGLTRAQLAQRLGISSSTVRAWEAGDISRPSSRVEGIFENYVNVE